MSDMLENMTLNKKSTKLNLVVFTGILFTLWRCFCFIFYNDSEKSSIQPTCRDRNIFLLPRPLLQLFRGEHNGFWSIHDFRTRSELEAGVLAEIPRPPSWVSSQWNMLGTSYLASWSDAWTMSTDCWLYAPPSEEIHFSLSFFKIHYWGLVTTHEGRDVDWPVYIQLCFYIKLNRSVQSLHCTVGDIVPVYLPISLTTLPHLWTSPWGTWDSNIFLIQGGHSTSLTRNHLRFWGVTFPQTIWVSAFDKGSRTRKLSSERRDKILKHWTTHPLFFSPAYRMHLTCCWQCRPSSHNACTGTIQPATVGQILHTPKATSIGHSKVCSQVHKTHGDRMGKLPQTFSLRG